ncbi:MAG TPA: YafY family protein [Bryobacteraceae bacterium]|nr:YafY family protein [Bryobacteraceae bacterium]
MRRADRLFQIVQHLRARRLTTAAQLSDWLEVSQRTVYRDIRDLSLSGVPVQGEAGVGYRIDRAYDLTPLMFTPDEVEAVVVGLRMAEAFAGPSLRSAARMALDKVALALPQQRRAEIERPQLFAPTFHLDPALGERVEMVRQAIAVRRKLEVSYRDKKEQQSRRVLRPLGLYFWGNGWSVAAWCESRQDFRSFWLHKMSSCTPLESTFEMEQDKSLAEFLRSVGATA